MKKAEIQKVVETTPQFLIQQGLKNKASIEVMERVFNLQERWEKNQAKKAFDQAMTNFQAECPIIKRSKDGAKTKAGELAFKYAPLELIVKEVQPLLKSNNLSYDFKPLKNKEGKVTDVRCYAKHVDGHSDYSEMPVGEGGGTSLMSNIQIVAANISFSKRYAFCNIFGIVTENEDVEQNLQPARKEDIEKAFKCLDECMNETKLLAVWSSFSKEVRANKNVIVFANQIKNNIKNAKDEDPKV